MSKYLFKPGAAQSAALDVPARTAWSLWGRRNQGEYNSGSSPMKRDTHRYRANTAFLIALVGPRRETLAASWVEAPWQIKVQRSEAVARAPTTMWTCQY